uniref:Uncharacterized protein LOC102809191 n=1 Tax=Saccoglossus kowalevskii TaxID=10224 RepID=A0ABM0LUB7_SACKO|nr:PREDICTED: uncharacterized protein LOC102809191 [Saccoglossus kowalevskii]
MKELSCISKVIAELKSGQEGVVKSVTFMSDKFEEMAREIALLKKAIGELNQENHRLRSQVNTIEKDLNELNQYHRRINLEITGIPETRDDENTENIVLNVLKKIDPETTEHDIDVTHRIGKREDSQRNDRPRRIIVRFTTRKKRNVMTEDVN